MVQTQLVRHLESGMRRFLHVKVFIIDSLGIILICCKWAIFFNNCNVDQFFFNDKVHKMALFILIIYFKFGFCWQCLIQESYDHHYVTFFLATCSPLSLENGLVCYTTSMENGRYLVATVASFSCNSGYYKNGTNSRVCQSSGSWNGQTPIFEGFLF